MSAAGMDGLKTSTLGPKLGLGALPAKSGAAQPAKSASIKANRSGAALARRQHWREGIISLTFPLLERRLNFSRPQIPEYQPRQHGVRTFTVSGWILIFPVRPHSVASYTE
jgi:hypothetical protein